MGRKVRIGIIGCGGIANGKHMPALKKIEEAEMVAFCDIIEERAVKAAKEFGVEGAKVYTDYRKLLEDESIESVHVCTPNRSHSFITIDALEAGKHVMCEKPMAKTYAEAKKMYETAQRTGKKLTIGYQQRWRPDSLYLKEACDNGDLGDIYYGALSRCAAELFRHGAFSSTSMSRAAVRLSISALTRSISHSG